MKKLRLLIVNFNNKDVEGPSYLSNELQHIQWNTYPASPFPENFHPPKLKILKLHHSLQEELWKDFKVIQLFL